MWRRECREREAGQNGEREPTDPPALSRGPCARNAPNNGAHHAASPRTMRVSLEALTPPARWKPGNMTTYALRQ